MSRVVAFRPKYPAPSNLTDIASRRILITNATHGAGPVVAHAFAAHGCQMVLQSGEPVAVAGLAGEISDEAGDVRVFGCGLADGAGAGRLSRAALSAYGGIDVVVNQLDLGAITLAHAATPEDCEAALLEALEAQTVVAEEAAEGMRQAGRGGLVLHLVIIGDAGKGCPRDALARHAVTALTMDAARTWQEHAIRVNVIVAEQVETDRALEEISGIALMLADDGGRHLSGKVLAVR